MRSDGNQLIVIFKCIQLLKKQELKRAKSIVFNEYK